MYRLWQDLGFAWRNAIKQPGTTALILATLALAIGANSAIFSTLYQVILAPLPYADSERLVRLQQNESKSERNDIAFSVPLFEDIKQQAASFSEVAEYHSMQFTLLGDTDPVRVQTGVVSWNYFSMLGITPRLGRGFNQDDGTQGAAPLILLSYEFWQHQFGADPGIVGRSLEMNNAVHQVIGVLPPMPAYPDANDIWITNASCPFRSSDNMIQSRSMAMLQLFAKVAPGKPLTQALAQTHAELDMLSARLSQAHPDIYKAPMGYELTTQALKTEMLGDTPRVLYLLLAITGLVILIACANVANLNLARLANRTQELAVREALGADRRRIARQLLSESLALSVTGAVLGLALSYPLMLLLQSLTAYFTPLASEVSLDATVFLCALVFAVITGLLSGSATLWRRRSILDDLKSGGSKHTESRKKMSLRRVLLVVQFALSSIILSCAVLSSLSLLRLQQVDSGFDAEQVLVVSLDLNFSRYPDATQIEPFITQLLERTRALPGVAQAGIGSDFPLASQVRGPVAFEIQGQPLVNPDLRPRAQASLVSEDYHKALGVPLLRGRLFNTKDDTQAPGTVLINESMAQTFFTNSNANANPIGQRLSFDNGRNWLEIVGVVADVRQRSLTEPQGPAIYAALRQQPVGALRLLVRSSGDPHLLTPAIRQLVRNLDAQQAIASIRSLDQIQTDSIASERMIALLTMAFALLASAITLSGVAGVVSFDVSRARQEIGIRMALGATPQRIIHAILLRTLPLALIGIGMGLALLLTSGADLDRLLFATSLFEWRVHLIVIAALLLTGLAAMWLPARNAARLDPMSALRSE